MMAIAKNLGFIFLFMIFAECRRSNPSSDGSPSTPPLAANKYRNPVFQPILADPTVVKDSASGYYYAYGTQDYWSTDNKTHLVAIVRSKDLAIWNYVADAFASKPTWKDKGGIWAPDVVSVGGKYHLYYAYSTWGDPDPGVGLAIASSAGGPFTDQGKLFLSSEAGVPNSIDPFYIEDNGKKYLFWGSFSNSSTQGTYGVPLSDDGKSVPDLTAKFRIAAGDFEGVMVHKHGNYYYFFGSRGSCCNGASSTYELRVARAQHLQGPYLDKNGNDVTARGNGTLVLSKNSWYVGPGHDSRIVADTQGNDWILYHAMDATNAMIGGVNQRALMLDRVNWDAAGWPVINDGTPSYTEQTKPSMTK